MSETKHTPGPWFHDWSDGNYAVLAHNGGKTRIVAFIREDTDEDKANARLIAAAPDLLTALEEIADGEGADSPVAFRFKDIARAAIAKESGRI